MNDLDAARLMCVLLQKRDSGEAELKKLQEKKKNLKPIQIETRDCPIYTDKELEPESLLQEPPCPFSQPYINTKDFQKKLATYIKKRQKGNERFLDDLLYEDQILYIRYLNQKENIARQNLEIQYRNKEKRERKKVSDRNRSIQNNRYQIANEKRKSDLTYYAYLVSIFEKGIIAANKMLDFLYLQNHVAPEVRNLNAISQIYGYLWSRQCASIGIATKEYLDREWKKNILNSLNNLSEVMHSIIINQTDLQRSISDLKRGNQQIIGHLQSLNIMSENMGNILENMNGTLENINSMKLGDV